MQEEDRQSDDDIWSRCVELKEGRCKRKRKRKNQSEERQQIQETRWRFREVGAFHANTPQHQRGRHGHHGADDKVAGCEANGGHSQGHSPIQLHSEGHSHPTQVLSRVALRFEHRLLRATRAH